MWYFFFYKKGVIWLSKLTLKQKRFADEYIISGNATDAARKAGYSAKTANRIGAENLSKLVIREYVEKRLKEIETAQYLTMDEALKITAAIARGEPRTIETVVDGVVVQEIIYPSFADSKNAVDQFYKIHGKFTSNVNITTPQDIEISVDYGDD